MKILHAFKINLTAEQTRRIRAAWLEHGGHGSAILADPRVGVTQARGAPMNCIVIDHALGAAIADTVAKARTRKPRKTRKS